MASSSSMDPAWFINHVIIWNNIVPVQWIYIRKINNDPRTPTIFDAIAARWYDLNQNFPPIARFNYAVVITTVKLSPRWFTWKWKKKKKRENLNTYRHAYIVLQMKQPTHETSFWLPRRLRSVATEMQTQNNTHEYRTAYRKRTIWRTDVRPELRQHDAPWPGALIVFPN